MNRSIRLASSPSLKHNSRRRSLARAAVEAVEARRLLASVAGVVFNDANANGKRDPGEAGLYNEVVYADRNNNNVYDGTDVATRADASGAYKLANLPADGAAITVRVRGDTGKRVVAPAGKGYAVKLTTASPDLVGKDFAVKPVTTPPTAVTISIVPKIGGFDPDAYAGFFQHYYVWNDVDADGVRDASEPLIGQREVGYDAAFNGGALAYDVSAPSGSTYHVGLSASPAVNATAAYELSGTVGTSPAYKVVEVAPIGSVVAGVVFQDANRNGVRDTGETTTKSAGVYADYNDNNTPDAGEPATTTYAGDDPTGDQTIALNKYVGYYFLPVSSGKALTVRFAGAQETPNNTGVQTGTPARVTPAANQLVRKDVGFALAQTPTTTSLTGRVTNDANGNGVADAGEAGINFEVVYLDRNNNNVYDGTDLATRTDANGNYTLAGVALDGSTATVRLRDVKAPRTVTAPSGAAYVLTLSAASTKTNLNFSVSPTAVATPKTVTINGRAFVDRDSSNTYTAGDGTAIGTVFADLNTNLKLDAGEPSTQRAADGTFTLNGVPAGRTVNIVALNVDGTSTFKVLTTTTPAAGGTVNGFAIIAPAPAQPTTATISGRVTDDANRNGVADAGEGGLAGVLVYADYANNGVSDGADDYALTDASGAYSLTVKPGAATLRLAGPSLGDIDGTGEPSYLYHGQIAVSQTAPASNAGRAVNATAGSSTGNVNFGAVNAAYVRIAPKLSNLSAFETFRFASQPTYAWIDANKNGIREASETLVSIDPNSIHHFHDSPYAYLEFFLARGTYTFGFSSSSAVGAKATATLTETVTASSYGEITDVVTVPTVGSGVLGHIFSDTNGNGTRDAGEPNGFVYGTVFADYNGNGTLDAGEPSGTVFNDPDFPSAVGYYSLNGLTPGRAFTVRLQNPDSSLAQTNAPLVTVAANQFLTGVDVGVGPRATTTTTISGRVTNDANANGVADAGEAGLYFEVVYLDSNNNGLPDTGETAVRTDANGYYSFANVPLNGSTVTVRLRSIFAPRKVTAPAGNGYAITLNANAVTTGLNFGIAPAPVVNGRVYNDANYSRGFDAGDSGLSGVTVFADYDGDGTIDANEPSTTTLADGSYALSTNRGNFQVRAAFGDTTYAQTTQPDYGYEYADVTGAQQATVNFGFGRIATVSGRINEDANRNGRPDNGEGGIAGVLVYADYNGNGQADYLEPTATTDVNGAYSFDTRRAAFSVRIDQPSLGYAQTTYGVLLTSATTNNGVAIDVTSLAKKVDVNFSGLRLTEVSIAPHLSNADAEAFYRFGGGPRFAWVDIDHDGVHDANEPLVGTNNVSLDVGHSFPTYEFLLPTGAYEIDFATSGEVGATAAVRKTGTITTSTPTFVVLDGTVPTTETIAFGHVSTAPFGPYPFDGTVYADYNDNQQLDAGEPTTSTFDGGVTYSTYNDYFALHVEPGRAFTIRLTNLPPNYVQTVAPRLTVAANQFLTTGTDVAVVNRAAAVVSGHIFNDANRNGVRDAGETSITQQEAFVYADYNNDGVIESDEPGSGTVNQNGDMTYELTTIKSSFALRLFLRPGYVQTSPANGAARIVDLTNADSIDGQDFGIAPA